MILSMSGTNTLEFEITNIEKSGFWLLADELEYFVGFTDFPGFKNATLNQILNVRRLDQNQFYWPDLDIDIDIASLESPEHYPLVYRQ